MKWILLIGLSVVTTFLVVRSEKCEKDIVITIQRSSCFGYCPVYSAEIYANGEVVYVGKENVKEIGERRFQISQETVQQLIKEFFGSAVVVHNSLLLAVETDGSSSGG